jgi:hypothetical protein
MKKQFISNVGHALGLGSTAKKAVPASMKKRMLTWLLSSVPGLILNAQISGNGFFYSPATNYGYTSGVLSANATVPIANNTTFITTPGHIYYIGNNAKLCDYFYDGTNWQHGGQLEWDWVFANTAVSPVNDGEDVFFVGTDAKIYKCSWTSASGWHSTMLDAAQSKACDASFPIIFKEYGGTKRVLYVCATTNKVCYFYKSGSTWSYGGEMDSNVNSEPVRAGTRIISDGQNHVYYIGANTGRVHNYYWNGSAWADGVLSSTSQQVMAGTNLQFDGNELYYIGTNKYIYRMYWNTSGWNTVAISSAANAVACNFFTYHNNRIYYGEASGYMSGACSISCMEKVAGSWTGTSTQVINNGDFIAPASEINVLSNPIYFEGSSTNFFYSHQVSYKSLKDGKIHYCILDYALGDESYTPFWHNGGLNANAPAVSSNHSCIGYNADPNQKILFYPGTNGYMNFFTRKVKNLPAIANMHLTFQQEFNTPDPGLTQLNTDWNINWPWGSGGNYATNSSFYHADITHNCAIANGDLTLSTIQETGQGTEYGSANYTNDAITWDHPEQCTPITYNYTSQQVHTGGQNAAWSGCGPWHADQTFAQQGGVFEARLKIPRAKDAWPAFWFISNTGEIDFELGGNGKNLFCNSYKGTTISRMVGEPAVGYRFYDDYYTLAIKPTSTGITWYLNNEEIFQTSEINYYPTTPLIILVQQLKQDRNYTIPGFPTGFATNEINPSVNYLTVDYVRAYQYNSKPVHRENNEASFSDAPPSKYYADGKYKGIKVKTYPNPLDENGRLNLDLGNVYGKVTVELQNGLGQPVKSMTVENTSNTELDLSQVPSGMYFIKITCDKEKPVIKKVVKP